MLGVAKFVSGCSIVVNVLVVLYFWFISLVFAYEGKSKDSGICFQ